jgi:hypothetical protein
VNGFIKTINNESSRKHMNNLTSKSSKLVILVMHLWLLPSLALSAPKALLIGLSQYQYPAAFAPAIDNLNIIAVEEDLKRMATFAQQLGFANNNIITLTNETATEQNIKRTITEHLVRRVSEDDRVLIYFSGHGSVVWDDSGDESDNKDEVLLAYDAHFVEKHGRYQLTGRIIDDEMGELLAKIPSKRLLFIVDACHSGNINKSFSLTENPTFKTKFADNPHIRTRTYSAMKPKRLNSHLSVSLFDNTPKSKQKGITLEIARHLGFDLQPSNDKGRVFFTATNETGKAIANSQGSLFTASLIQGLSFSQSSIKSTSDRINLNSLRTWVYNDLKARYPAIINEPQLFGDEQLIEQGF